MLSNRVNLKDEIRLIDRLIDGLVMLCGCMAVWCSRYDAVVQVLSDIDRSLYSITQISALTDRPRSNQAHVLSIQRDI